ncbi:MAG: DinB family protein [Thermomicrobium sp.]|nr:DinB family protein [Thermomicrobium sp.]MDW7982909.1 DinB family protein [Thermomicrobium sp.]
MAVATHLLRFNRWANQAIVAHCRTVDPAVLDAPPPLGVYGTIRETLAHLATAEAVYVARLRGEEPQRLAADADLDTIASWLERSGAALEELAETTPPDRVLSFVSPTFGELSVPAWVLLGQAIVHGCAHRAQLATLFTQLGTPLPELDMWRFAGVTR